MVLCLCKISIVKDLLKIVNQNSNNVFLWLLVGHNKKYKSSSIPKIIVNSNCNNGYYYNQHLI